MKNKFWSLLCLPLILAAMLMFTACTADPVYTYTLDPAATDEGVEIKETTVFMKVGDTAQIVCSSDVIQATASKSLATVSVTTGDRKVIKLSAMFSGTCEIKLRYNDNSTSSLGVYIRNAECASCEQEFSSKDDYEGHTQNCGHACLGSVPSEHLLCDDCKMYVCNEAHESHYAPCGHTWEEAESISDHTILADCGHHYRCTGKNHQPYLCGHYLCHGVEMEKHVVGDCGHYSCQPCEHKTEMECGCLVGTEGTHELLECGHYACASGEHMLGSCEEHWTCEEGDHGEAACGHPACWIKDDDGSHTTLAECGEHYLCLGWEECTQFNDCGDHYLCVTLYDANHTNAYLMPCGEHYLCQVGENEEHSFTQCLLHPQCQIEEGDETHATLASCGHHPICSYSDEHPGCSPCELCTYCLADGTEHGVGVCVAE